MPDRIKWCLIGIPDHQGVMNIGGRVGAAGGPAAFEKAFFRLKGEGSVRESLKTRVMLEGVSQDIESNHRIAADLIERTHRNHSFSVIVGGGHDHGYSHLLGISKVGRSEKKAKKESIKLGCINIDAHLDVRSAEPVITSGSPFRLAIDSGVLDAKRFIEFGIQKHCNGPELWAYIRKQKVQTVPFEKLRNGKAARFFQQELRKLAKSCDLVVISLDLDAASSAFAPGVSAPQAEGFSASDILEMMEIAGAEKKVTSLGIFELNPEHDIDNRTAALAATSAWHFAAAKKRDSITS